MVDTSPAVRIAQANLTICKLRARRNRALALGLADEAKRLDFLREHVWESRRREAEILASRIR